MRVPGSDWPSRSATNSTTTQSGAASAAAVDWVAAAGSAGAASAGADSGGASIASRGLPLGVRNRPLPSEGAALAVAGDPSRSADRVGTLRALPASE